MYDEKLDAPTSLEEELREEREQIEENEKFLKDSEDAIRTNIDNLVCARYSLKKIINLVSEAYFASVNKWRK